MDVNVHPTKNEVRFVNPHQVHEAVKSAIAQTLYEIDRVNWRPVNGSQRQEPQKTPQIAESSSSFAPAGGEVVKGDFGFRISDFGIKNRGQQPAAGTSSQQPAARAQIFGNRGFSALRVVGQLHNTYIVCESDAGLVLIDHHAAHERILFRTTPAACRRSTSCRPAAFGARNHRVKFQGSRNPGANAFGFKNFWSGGRTFGKNTFVIKAVPELLSGRDVKPDDS